LKNFATQAGLLVLGALPFLVGGLMALRLWLDPATTPSDWKEPIWPVVILYGVALFAFIIHACGNKNLRPGELDYRITQFLVMPAFGMFEYWRDHVLQKDHLGQV
jgi:hypothetical protein